MRRITSFVLVCILLSQLDAPLQAFAASPPQYFRVVEDNAAQRYQKFEALFRQFIQIVESSLQLRRDAKMLFGELHERLSGDEHLTSEDQQALKRKLTQYRENYEGLGRFISAYRFYSDVDATFRFPATQPSQGLEGSGAPSGANFQINPHDDLGRLMVLELKVLLAAKLIILDNYVVVLTRYLKQSESRRQFDLDTIDPRAKLFLEQVTDELGDGDRYRRILKIIKLVQGILEYEKDNRDGELALDKDNSYLNTLINGSYAYHRIPELTVLDKTVIEFAATRNAFVDDVSRLTDKGTYEVSELFGNIIGLYEERKGKLYDMAPKQQKLITSELRLLDILLEKTPFRLTDRFIPGHWGHVAIWVGDHDDIPELKRLGVWDELPAIEAEARSRWGYSGPSFQSLIENGHGVLEALRPGVELNTFAHFLNIDDLAVIRNANLTDERMKYYLLRAFAQIGKEYDFNFDVETHKRIVCSELAFVVYDDYDWPVEESVGRYTVSPDHVAALALEINDPFSPILVLHDGKELPKRHNRANFRMLLEGTYDRILYLEQQ